MLLTDHDTLEAKDRGEEGWYGRSRGTRTARARPSRALRLGTSRGLRQGGAAAGGHRGLAARRNHYLAFGIDRTIDHDGLDAAGICRAVSDAGGFGFAAHPFSRGSERFRERAPGMPFDDLECEALHGVELWSFVNDTGEAVGSVAGMLRFVAMPARVLDHPPERNMRIWD